MNQIAMLKRGIKILKGWVLVSMFLSPFLISNKKSNHGNKREMDRFPIPKSYFHVPRESIASAIIRKDNSLILLLDLRTLKPEHFPHTVLDWSVLYNRLGSKFRNERLYIFWIQQAPEILMNSARGTQKT